MSDNLTLGETAESLHGALRDYIEATYHISDQGLVDQRRELLERPGVIGQVPFIESTPRYVSGNRFEELGLPAAAVDVLLKAASIRQDDSPLIHNPPYQHQAEALTRVLRDRSSIVVTTGTGSGKTECFLLPILGHLAQQASSGQPNAGAPSVRAIVLYPMNALVNDQLGRLRLLFGNRELARWFTAHWGRPARFARYTSRTLYPGVRSAKRDQQRLKPLRKYYIEVERRAGRSSGAPDVASRRLLGELRSRGKWPAKDDMSSWFGADGSKWQDKAGNYLRCITQPADPELLTRHEVLANPPDILVTNYSMLEYMLMRPLERPVFDATRAWLAANPAEKFLVVVDEAHLYRGAAGAEVGLLLRRLRDRIGIDASRLQVICTTASFSDASKAPAFGAALSGKISSDFVSITGSLALKEAPSSGSATEAAVLASIDLDAFYAARDEDRTRYVQAVLEMRGTTGGDAATALYSALFDYGPMKLLVNETMQRARPVGELATLLFPAADPTIAERAATVLVALGSYARQADALDGPGLLPSRLHAFLRGLPGLWVCVDPECTALPEERRGGTAGCLYEQPQLRCGCGARVFELFTCRHCGTAYARAYTDDLEAPSFLWREQGQGFSSASGQVVEMSPIDLLLGQPLATGGLRPADLDLVTGRIDPQELGARNRQVFLPVNVDEKGVRSGEFKPCGVCGKTAGYGRSSVQDHQTKGDEPFQALVTRQVEIQQPAAEATAFAPMAGRKVLVFSDSRQTAARLAPNLQKYTTRDAVRPLLLAGYRELRSDSDLRPFVSLEESYLAVLLAMARFGVRLRPVTRVGESFAEDLARVQDYLDSAAEATAVDKVNLLLDVRSRSQTSPESLTTAIHAVTNDQYTGIAALALATIEPANWKILDSLPPLGAEIDTPDQKRAVVLTWIDAWRGSWLHSMPTAWAEDEISSRSGKFASRMKNLLPKAAQGSFEKDWLPVLLTKLAQPVGKEFRLRGAMLSLDIGGVWGYCQSCRSTLRPVPSREDLCTYCGRHSVRTIDPDEDPVFLARKGYYRRSTALALTSGRAPIALVAAEHTAQLNEAQADAVFSEAEENELLFQDVDLGEGKPAIDVLSCTTTMEVGIDIGALSGVALRNMPPSRANYQQRSGRAGRRGKAIATVTAFASAQSHDEHGFSAPAEFIRGSVVDPEMTLDNWHIARRHLTAFVVQEYLQARIPIAPQAGAAPGSRLFEVLGSVASFRDPSSLLNTVDFRRWVGSEAPALASRARDWLPVELKEVADTSYLAMEVAGTADIIDTAIGALTEGAERSGEEAQSAADDGVEPGTETEDTVPGSASPPETLLGRLLYRGALPRYAFPTDVGTFHVFDSQESTRFRPVFRYTPSQGMPVALSQYAPGRRVWIGGREWVSGAVYSRMPEDRFAAWEARRLYMECSVCHYATTEAFDLALRGHTRDCPACGESGGLGPAQVWIRPPGFAHPYYVVERTSPDDDVAPSYATRAKLTTAGPADPNAWTGITERISVNFDRRRLLVTNRGPEEQGYSYCTRCGLIEPATAIKPVIIPGHRKPYPDEREPLCVGEATARALVLGTDFLSDVLLIGLRVDEPISLRPDYESTRVALRTLSEALTIQASKMLGIGSGELQAEFRPSLTAEGRSGAAAEIYMYDTLAGGAGFAQRAGLEGRRLFEGALALLENCPANCDSSCYRCLQSFKNQFEHSSLDRHLGASILRYLLFSETPTVEVARAESSADLLYEDLIGLGIDDLRLSRRAQVSVPGFGMLEAPILAERIGSRPVVIALHHPCSPRLLLDRQWIEPADVTVEPVLAPIDELAVRRNLPWASNQALRALGYIA